MHLFDCIRSVSTSLQLAHTRCVSRMAGIVCLDTMILFPFASEYIFIYNVRVYLFVAHTHGASGRARSEGVVRFSDATLLFPHLFWDRVVLRRRRQMAAPLDPSSFPLSTQSPLCLASYLIWHRRRGKKKKTHPGLPLRQPNPIIFQNKMNPNIADPPLCKFSDWAFSTFFGGLLVFVSPSAWLGGGGGGK